MASQYLPPNPAALARIDHVVVLMLENRSFDNLLGWLYDAAPPPRGQAFQGLRRELWCPLSNVDPDGIPFVEKVYVRKNGDPAPASFRHPDPDPGEGFRNTNDQLFGHYEVPDLYPPSPACLGFVDNYARAMLYGSYAFGDPPADPRSIMTAYTPEQVPVLSTLAREFAVCDEWYCSVPSQTLPNRDFVHAATSGGQVNNRPQPDCDAVTVFNRLQAASLPWRVYSGTSAGKPFSLTRLIMTQLHDPSLDASFLPIERFATDAAAGDLPSYAFLEPQLSGPGQDDQHPNADMRPGEKLIASVYDAVSSSPLWQKTLLVITYDEHGGCYDHVPPPGNATPPDGYPGAPGQLGFRFNRFGVRVPAVLVSPYIAAGTVARPKGSVPFDHSSVAATVLRRFKLDALTKRDHAAPDLSCVLTLDAPRADVPAVTPLDWTAPGHGGENDLQHIVADTLARMGGIEPPSPPHMTAFIHEQYARHFGAGA